MRKRTPLSAVAVAICLALSLLGFDCSSTPKLPVHWPDVVDCAADAGDLLGAVTRILLADGGGNELSADGRAKLEELAREKGADAVLCIVDQLLRDWTTPGATPEKHRVAATARAESFLRSTGAKVQHR